jgi:hypothetical protein
MALLLGGCKKYEDRLEVQNRSSGIIRVATKDSKSINGAKIDEVVTVYAKIGEPGLPVSFFVGGVEAPVLAHGTKYTDLATETGGNSMTVLVDTFNIKIPAQAKIGPGILYFTVNNVLKPALGFEVFRPDILVPGQSFVEPFLFTSMDSIQNPDGTYQYLEPVALKDGAPGKAVINKTLALAYDAASTAFYFIDQEPQGGAYKIRKLYEGSVTTLAGGGNDYMAITAAQLKLSSVRDLKAGPDGQLYFTSIFYADPDPVTGLQAAYATIRRLDPATGKVETLVGGIRKQAEFPFVGPDYRGVEDGGKDSAMVYYPESLCFDKEGNLYFLDGANEYEGGSLLRRYTKAGRVETVLGKCNKDYYEYEDVDGKIYTGIYYSNITEHSDGFGDEVRLFGGSNLLQAGNGKFYICSSGAGWKTNIVEVNLDTKEASTIAGMPDGQNSSLTTGTFREVALDDINTFDLDFDGNILLGSFVIYKMDLQKETIAKLAGGRKAPGNTRDVMRVRQKGEDAVFFLIDRIVFDQFGNLYAGYSTPGIGIDVRISKVIIEQ